MTVTTRTDGYEKTPAYVQDRAMRARHWVDHEKSLAFIGSAGASKQSCAEIFTALSITRLEGSRWCLRRTRWAMEKVRKCGLMFSRDEIR